MKRIRICVVTVLVLLAVWKFREAFHMDASPDDTVAYLEDWVPAEPVWHKEELELQRRLTRWYNLNLISDCPEADFKSAYDSILADGTGVLCYVELSGGGCLPVYRNGCQDPDGYGFEHNGNSAFPVGGAGNHSVFTWNSAALKADEWTQQLGLSEGAELRIHILDQVLLYRVDGVDHTEPELHSVEGRDLCTFLFYDEAGEKVWVRCASAEES